MTHKVDISGVDLAKALANLVNNTSAKGGDPGHRNAKKRMPVRDARRLLKARQAAGTSLFFKEAWGRPLFVDLGRDGFDPSRYDRLSPKGAKSAEQVIRPLRPRRRLRKSRSGRRRGFWLW